MVELGFTVAWAFLLCYNISLMSLYLRILTVIYGIAAFHGIILSLILWGKKKNRTANHILASLVFLFSIGMAGPIYVFYRLFYGFPFAAPFFSAAYFTFAPLLFLYIKALTRRRFQFKRSDLLHGLPALVNFLYFSSLYLMSSSGRTLFLEKMYFQKSVFYYFSIILSLVQTFAYMVLCLRLLRVHSRKIKESFSVVEKINLSWMRHLVIMFVVIWLIVFALQGFLPEDLIEAKLDDAITFFLISLIIFSIGYRGLSQPEIFAELPFEPDAAETDKGKKYEKTGLSPDRGELLKEQLVRLMEEEKLFLDQELTLAQVAEQMDVPPHQLSQVINERLEQNFYQFVNNYRVEEARRRLQDAKTGGDKLIKIAFDSGFNSLATFNRVFKDLSGESPSQFRKRHNIFPGNSTEGT